MQLFSVYQIYIDDILLPELKTGFTASLLLLCSVYPYFIDLYGNFICAFGRSLKFDTFLSIVYVDTIYLYFTIMMRHIHEAFNRKLMIYVNSLA